MRRLNLDFPRVESRAVDFDLRGSSEGTSPPVWSEYSHALKPATFRVHQAPRITMSRPFIRAFTERHGEANMGRKKAALVHGSVRTEVPYHCGFAIASW